MANGRTRLQEIQEELRAARNTLETTERDDAQEMVTYWENELKLATNDSNNPVRPGRRKPTNG